MARDRDIAVMMFIEHHQRQQASSMLFDEVKLHARPYR
jgi:hypothetical protein